MDCLIKPTIPVSELNGEHIRLHFVGGNSEDDRICELHADSHPTLPYASVKARFYVMEGRNRIVSRRLVFDAARMARVREVSHPEYQYEADLGKLASVSMDPEISKAVERETQSIIACAT